MRPYSRTRVTLVCRHCGRSFWDYASQITPHHPHHFCSRACAGAARCSTPESFWALVVPIRYESGWECLEFTGRIRWGGYGYFGANKRYQYAHRHAWELFFGPIPSGLLVCHECDNRACVHPGHLYLDTQKGNLADMYARGRGPTAERSGPALAPFLFQGEANGRAKLTEAQVREIRAACAAGERQCDVAARYGMGQSAISAIVRRQHWPHVD